MKCWWIFFHKWGKWIDTPGSSALFLWQRRECQKCGRKQERYV